MWNLEKSLRSLIQISIMDQNIWMPTPVLLFISGASLLKQLKIAVMEVDPVVARSSIRRKSC